MSVALDLSRVPEPAPPSRRHLASVPVADEPFDMPLAPVAVLHRPATADRAAPLRLTRRGVVVLGAAVAILGAALVWLAALSAPHASAGVSGATGTAGTAGTAPHTVVVHPGDTLWSIAGRVAPQADPQAEVAALQQANHLHSVMLQPGQRLRVP